MTAGYRPGKFRPGVVVSVGGYTYTADGPDVPEEHARLMPNPKLWERAPEFADQGGDDGGGKTQDGGGGQNRDTAPEPPPLSGPEASTSNWVAYAAAVEVSTEGMTKRSEIIDALAAAGKPTERK